MILDLNEPFDLDLEQVWLRFDGVWHLFTRHHNCYAKDGTIVQPFDLAQLRAEAEEVIELYPVQ